MKRSGPLRRLSPLARRTRPRPRSRKAQAVAPVRAAFVKRILEERPRCEFPAEVRQHTALAYALGHRQHYEPAVEVIGFCWRASVDVHEKLTRARGGDILDEDNVLAICREHHDWVHANPKAATELGLLLSQWDRRLD
jgi:hypothetical protein